MTFLPSSKVSTGISLKLSAGAKRDLQAIGSYTLKQWGAAQKQYYLELIKKSLEALLLSCNGVNVVSMGKARPELSLDNLVKYKPQQGSKPTGCALFYSYTIKQHNVYYRMVSDKTNKHEVVIVRILHTRMEPTKHIT